MDNTLCQLSKAKIRQDGLFLNADSGFDCIKLKYNCIEKDIIPNIDRNPRNNNTIEEEQCYYFDKELYKSIWVIERTNAWLDSFKTILIRYETNNIHWRTWHFLAFIIILLRKV